MRLTQVIVFLPRHQKSLLVLLLQEHQLHLVVFQRVALSLTTSSTTHSLTAHAELHPIHALSGYLVRLREVGVHSLFCKVSCYVRSLYCWETYLYLLMRSETNLLLLKIGNAIL